MGILVEKVDKPILATTTEVTRSKHEDKQNNNASIFSIKNENLSTALIAVSIPSAILLGIAGYKFLPKIIKSLKNPASKKAMGSLTETKAAQELKGAAPKEEIERLEKLIEEERSKFFKANESRFIDNDEVALQKRIKEMIPFQRGQYGLNSTALDNMATVKSYNKKTYLDTLWHNTPQAKKVYFELEWAKMSTEEKELFNKAMSAFKAKNIPVNPYDLACTFDGQNIMKSIAQNGFIETDYVVGSNYAFRVNGLLRRGINVEDDILVKTLDQGFKEVRPIGRNTKVYRSVTGSSEDISGAYIQQLVHAQKGDVVIDKGYSFTSFKRQCAQACNGTWDGKTPTVLLNIQIPKGARISDNAFAQQCEALLPRNAKFEVVQTAHVTRSGIPYTAGDGTQRKGADSMEMTLKFIGTTNQKNGILNKIKTFLHI